MTSSLIQPSQYHCDSTPILFTDPLRSEGFELVGATNSILEFSVENLSLGQPAKSWIDELS